MRRYGEEKMELLDRLGHASSKAQEGPLEPTPAPAGRPPEPRRALCRHRVSGVFDGKSVLVTGGSRGIGRGIALRFAERGAARVGVSYLRNDRAAEETAEELRKLGAEPLLLRGNLGDPERVTGFLEETGPLDVLVSNAATGVIRPALELTEKHWDWTMNANARVLLTLARAAAPSMPRGSSIVAISSLGSTRVLDDYVLVGTSKAAIESLVRYLAVELAPQGSASTASRRASSRRARSSTSRSARRCSTSTGSARRPGTSSSPKTWRTPWPSWPRRTRP